jgi:hypothetical protein
MCTCAVYVLKNLCLASHHIFKGSINIMDRLKKADVGSLQLWCFEKFTMIMLQDHEIGRMSM